MKTVVIESPFAGDVDRNIAYARACMLDCLRRGEAPFASHLLYTQCLDDLDPEERKLGIQAGLALGDKLDLTVVYNDLGISDGMRMGVIHADEIGRPVVHRTLGGKWSDGL